MISWSCLVDRHIIDRWPLGGGIGWMVALNKSPSKAPCPSREQWQVVFLRRQYWHWCCITSLSVIWTVGSTLSKFASNTKLCGMVDTLERRNAIQEGSRTGPRWWACANLRKFKKDNCRILSQGNSKHKYRLGREWVERSFLKERCGGVCGQAAYCDSAMGTHCPENQLYPELHPKQSEQQDKRGICPSAPPRRHPTCSTASSSGVPSTRCYPAELTSEEGNYIHQRVWSICPIIKNWESWGCLAWRREGSRENLE